ncbi:hypothetical protein Hanom_Chr01g00087111 [Helianthus anomalus]
MASISPDRFPLPHHLYHNLRIRTNFEGLALVGCQVILNMLMLSRLTYALSAHIMVYPDILQMFWRNATLLLHEGRGLTSIGSHVLNRAIVITENIIRRVLNLDDNNDVLLFTRAEIDETLELMGYNVDKPNRPISKNGFIKPW